MNVYRHCMIDLETLSTQPNAEIVSIGAVFFNQRGLGPTHYQAIRVGLLEKAVRRAENDSRDLFHVSRETVTWWQEQSAEARAVFEDSKAVHLSDALLAFSSWLHTYCHKDELRVWGNGAAFDNVILKHAYDALHVSAPWHHWNDRCYRTAKAMAGNSVKINRKDGVHHNAMADAIAQARHLIQLNELDFDVFTETP